MRKRYFVYMALLAFSQPLFAGGTAQGQRHAELAGKPTYPVEELELVKPITIKLPDPGLRHYQDSKGNMFVADMRQFVFSGSSDDYVSDTLVVLFPRSNSLLNFSVDYAKNHYAVASRDDDLLYFLSSNLLVDEDNHVYSIDLSTGNVRDLRLNKPAFLSLYRGEPHVWYNYGYTIQALFSNDEPSARYEIPRLVDELDWGASPFFRFGPMQLAGDYVYMIDAVYGKSPLEAVIVKLPVLDYSAPTVGYHFTNPDMTIEVVTAYPLCDVYSDGDTVIWSDRDSNFYILDEENKTIRQYCLRFESQFNDAAVLPFDTLYSTYYHSEAGRLLVNFPSGPVLYSDDSTEPHPIQLMYDIDLAEAKVVRLAVLVDCTLGANIRYVPSLKALAGIDTRFAMRLEDQTDLGQVQTWNWTW